MKEFENEKKMLNERIKIKQSERLDIHISVHLDIIYKNDQQDATV